MGKAVFHSLDVVSACAGFACLYSFCAYHYSTYEVDKDNFGIQILESFNCMPKVGVLRHKPCCSIIVTRGRGNRSIRLLFRAPRAITFSHPLFWLLLRISLFSCSFSATLDVSQGQ